MDENQVIPEENKNLESCELNEIATMGKGDPEEA